jgi:PAS domain S-box-containing protein
VRGQIILRVPRLSTPPTTGHRGDGVWDWDLRTGVETLSDRCREMYGLDADEGAHRPDDLDERTHPDDLARMLDDRQAHLDGRTPRYQNEHRIHCSDGSWKWVLTRGLVIARDEQGRPLRMIGTHTDITARKQADDLRQERDRADAADRAKTLLLSRVSHELRTPLNAVLGFAQLIENDPGVDPRHLVWVRHIRAGGSQLLELVDDLLDLASVQAGRLHLDLVPVDLPKLVAECWHMQSAAVQRQQVQWLPTFDDAAGLTVRADVRRLRQVVGNLVSNAIKYNRPSGEVRVTAVRRGDRVRLSVQDTGRGLDADQLARIFRPFERLGAQHTTVEGTDSDSR